MKLKVPATQRHHRERAEPARCLAISKFRFLYGLPTYSAGTGPANCWTAPSLASSLRSFTNLKCPSLALQLCSFYIIICMLAFPVDSSPQCSWRLWLEIFPSKFQRAFRHAGTEDDYRHSTIHRWRWVVNNTSRPLYPQKGVLAPIVEETGWAPRSVCMTWGWENFCLDRGSIPE